jgi:glycosyltransferase involved in cell wall biosynthesis
VLTSGLRGQKKKEIIHNFTVYRVPSWRKGIHDCGMRGAYAFVFFAALRLSGLIKVHSYDVLHYFFSLPTGLLSLIPGANREIPYIVSLRGSDVPHYDPFNRKLEYFHKLLGPLTRLIWRRAKEVVALSQGLKNTALETAPYQDISVIPNGVETDIFLPPESHHSTGRKQLRLILVSRLIQRKGIQHVFKAIADLADPLISLLVVGTGNYEKHLRTLCIELGLADSVTFYGYCPRVELPALYCQYDAFILPSMAESFGIVFAEAMACALPIIAGNTGGVPDLIKKENGILVTPGSVEEIKKAIMEFKNFPPKRAEMGAANRKRVVEYYSWENVARRYLHAYKKTDSTA